MSYYFSYGSNLHPLRLIKRISSAELVGAVSVSGYKLTFHKKSIDGSSKCNLFETKNREDVVFGAIYKIDETQKTDLDGFEGLGSGYTESRVKIVKDNEMYDCFTYIAQQSHVVDNLPPYHWYKKMVVIGAEYLLAPNEYIASIDSILSIEDPDAKRREEQANIITQMKNYS